jgi:hypothetical protein
MLKSRFWAKLHRRWSLPDPLIMRKGVGLVYPVIEYFRN